MRQPHASVIWSLIAVAFVVILFWNLYQAQVNSDQTYKLCDQLKRKYEASPGKLSDQDRAAMLQQGIKTSRLVEIMASVGTFSTPSARKKAQECVTELEEITDKSFR